MSIETGTYGPAQTRIITAALDLFGKYGISGTSLQMIADAVGVTKAAIYHKFRTKDEIVLAVAEVELAALNTAIEAAEQEQCDLRGREVLLTKVTDLAVARRQAVSMLQTDPAMIRFLAEHEPFQRLMERLFAVLVGTDADAEARVPAAMLIAAIGGAVVHPFIMDLDDDTLRYHLHHLARRLFQIPE